MPSFVERMVRYVPGRALAALMFALALLSVMPAVAQDAGSESPSAAADEPVANDPVATDPVADDPVTEMPADAGQTAPVTTDAAAGEPPAAEAQAAADEAQADASAIDAEQLIKVLEDPAARARLIAYLRALNEAEAQRLEAEQGDIGTAALDAASQHLKRINDGISALARALSDLPDIFIWLIEQSQDPAARDLWLEIAARVFTILVLAAITRWLVLRASRRPMRSMSPSPTERIWVALPMQLVRLLLALLVPASVAVVTYATLSVLQPRETTRLVVLAILNAYLIVAIVMAIVRELLASDSVYVRATHISGESAEYIIAWTGRLMTIAVYGYFAAKVALLLGLPLSAYMVLLRLLGLVLAGLAIVLILQNRHSVAGWIRGHAEQPSRIRARLADIWHILAIVYVVGFYFVWALAIPGGFQFLLRATLLTIGLIVGAQLLLFGLGFLLRKAFALSAETMEDHPGLEERANRYLPAVRRLAKAFVFIGVAFAILEVWGFGTLTWLGTDAGATLINTVSIIILVVVLALILSELFGLMVERYLRRLDEKHVSGTRARTLLPLLRTAFRVVLIVMVTLVVLSQIGVDIAPLLAGAGVVGLAIGFGAQKLVQDVITGFFILVEDSISVGDVVEAGGHSGSVESMTIRSLVLRDGDGVVHTVPFSSVSTVKNFSKDFAYALIDVSVSYRENTDHVIEVLREIGEDIRNNSPVKHAITGPLEIFGVNELGETSVIIQARFRTRPLQQWTVKREFLRRIKMEFDKRGIEIPFRHQQTLYVADAALRTPGTLSPEEAASRSGDPLLQPTDDAAPDPSKA